MLVTIKTDCYYDCGSQPSKRCHRTVKLNKFLMREISPRNSDRSLTVWSYYGTMVRMRIVLTIGDSRIKLKSVLFLHLACLLTLIEEDKSHIDLDADVSCYGGAFIPGLKPEAFPLELLKKYCGLRSCDLHFSKSQMLS